MVTLHEGGRHTGNSSMQDAGVNQELRMREVGHADRSINDRYTHPLEQAVGYIPFEAEAANLFFQLVSGRYERASLVVTSNKPFGKAHMFA